MNVLSLFDGISCARVALDKAGIVVKTYSASEIDKNAIRISTKNYPDIVRLGNVCDVKETTEPIDLLIGGSPCQDLSIAKKGRQGLKGNRSSLFWEYVRIKEELKPTWFILENVASMAKEDRDEITRVMGVEPILINASLVSAQCRKRLFWTNIPNVTQPKDRGILLKDILQSDGEVDERFLVNGKSLCLTASYSKTSREPKEKEVLHEAEKRCRTLVFNKTAQTGRNATKKLGYVGDVDHQAKRVYDDNGKLPALNVVCNSMVKIGHIGNSDSQGNRVYSPEGKSITLSANGGGGGAKTGLYNIGRIRKLTPIECERLQSLPDNYTEGIAMTNRYKCLGNAFNTNVIAHILQHIPSGF